MTHSPRGCCLCGVYPDTLLLLQVRGRRVLGPLLWGGFVFWELVLYGSLCGFWFLGSHFLGGLYGLLSLWVLVSVVSFSGDSFSMAYFICGFWFLGLVFWGDSSCSMTYFLCRFWFLGISFSWGLVLYGSLSSWVLVSRVVVLWGIFLYDSLSVGLG